MRQLQLCLLCASALLAAPAYADITLGQIAPLSGEHAAAGHEIAAGAKAYIDKVNAEGGVAGQKIVYVLKDNADQPAQTQAQAAALIQHDHVYGILPGAGSVQTRELVSGGLLRQHQVPLLALHNAAADEAPLASSAEGIGRDTGLIEITPPAGTYAPLVNEFRATLAKYGAPGAIYSSAGLQGYIAAKVMVGAVRLLPPVPSREEYFAALRNMIPDLSSRLIVSSGMPR
jgi:hypothetical protein